MPSLSAQWPPPSPSWSQPTGAMGTLGTGEVITGQGEVTKEDMTPHCSWRTSGISPDPGASLKATEEWEPRVRPEEDSPRKMEMVPSGATMITITT